MKTNIEIFFEAIQKNDIKIITNDWIYILSDIFPKAVLHYDDFLIFKDFYDRLSEISFDQNYLKLSNLTVKQNDSLINLNIQSYAETKILSLLPNVYSFLNNSYKTFGIFCDNTTSLYERIVNKQVLDFKWWIEIYFSPHKLIENLNNKSKLTINDFELIAGLNLSEHANNVYKVFSSKRNSTERRSIALETLFLLRDKKTDFYLKKIVMDQAVEEDIRIKVIRNLLTRKIADDFFWESVVNSITNNDVIKLTQLLIFIINNPADKSSEDLLISEIENAADDNLIIILNMIYNFYSEFELALLFRKVFTFLFYERYESIIDTFTKQTIKQFTISNIALRILFNFFNINGHLKKKFEKLFISGIKKSISMNRDLSNNFIILLKEIMNQNELEFILTKTINSYKTINKRRDVVFKLRDFFPLYTIDYNDKTEKTCLTRK